MRATKIVATIGPASDDADTLDAIIRAGVDVARLNASHASLADLERRFAAVRAAEERTGRSVAVMLDLPGPKLRLGDMEPGVELSPGDDFALTTRECVGDAHLACVSHDGLDEDLAPGVRVLLDDGAIELEVVGIEPGIVRTRVIAGGPVGSHKGVNVPGVTLHGVRPVTDHDRELVIWGISAGVDFIAQSFVRRAEDVEVLREILGDSGIPIVAKIEKHEAADDIECIVAAADAVMVARGDLGVETSPEEVPVLQRRIVWAARAAGVPVIVATQMLESMITNARPTRAEAGDVAAAIFDGVDAVMLSAETAVGAHPVEAVDTMARIVGAAECASRPPHVVARAAGDIRPVGEAVSASACTLASDVGAAAIVPVTQGGGAARAVARHRPVVPVIAATPSRAVARRLALVWGVRTIELDFPADTDTLLDFVAAAIRDCGAVAPHERIVLTAGRGTRRSGGTNLLLVREV